jgi:hypothetical protein
MVTDYDMTLRDLRKSATNGDSIAKLILTYLFNVELSRGQRERVIKLQPAKISFKQTNVYGTITKRR